MCSYTFCIFPKNKSWTFEKQSHGNKRTTNSTGALHKDQHRAACTPHRTFYSSQESRSLHIFQHLPSDSVESHR